MGKKETLVSEQKYSIPLLQRHAFELFNVPTSTFDGATAGLDGEFTVEEVRQIINDWKKKEAK